MAQKIKTEKSHIYLHQQYPSLNIVIKIYVEFGFGVKKKRSRIKVEE